MTKIKEKPVPELSIIGKLSVDGFGELKHDLGFYKGLSCGLMLSVIVYLAIKFYLFMFR